jgi:hypothetical protein
MKGDEFVAFGICGPRASVNSAAFFPTAWVAMMGEYCYGVSLILALLSASWAFLSTPERCFLPLPPAASTQRPVRKPNKSSRMFKQDQPKKSPKAPPISPTRLNTSNAKYSSVTVVTSSTK